MGYPGRGKKFLSVVKEVEIELSRNNTFEIIEDDTVLKCGQTAVYIGTARKWIPKVRLHAETQIPYLSDGDVSMPCMAFFQNPRDYDERGPTPRFFQLTKADLPKSHRPALAMTSFLPGMKIAGPGSSDDLGSSLC